MSNYTAADVKALRERSGAGMMDCKKALDETDGDLEKAMEALRLKGLKGVTKREGRSTSEGLIASRVNDGKGFLMELACETDFVAKGEKFIALADSVADALVGSDAKNAEEALKAPMGSSTVEEQITNEAAILGEKVELRKFETAADESLDAYMHRTSKDLPPQVGVLLAFSGGDAAVAHDVAVHIAAFSPTYMSREDVPADLVEKERSIAEETARNEGKPEQALPKIVEGRVTGFFKENVLLDQAFAKDPKQSVGQVLDNAGVKVSSFVRLRVGS